MRLIDADELIKCLEHCAWNDATEVVNAQPTAYDVEKVVAELEEEGKFYARYSVNTEGVKSIPTYKAINLVRKGGGMKEFIKSLLDELEKIPTEYRNEEYNNAIWDVIKFIKRYTDNYNNGWHPYSETKLPPAGYVRDVWLTLEEGVFKAVWKRDHFEWENEFLVTETPIAWKFCDIPEPYQPKGK